MSQLDSKLDEAPMAPTPAANRGVFVEKQRANVYTVLLVLSLVAIVIACLCLYGEMSLYNFDFKAAGAKVPV